NHSANYPRKEDLVTEGVPFIRATNLVEGAISGEDMRFLSLEKHALLKKGHLKTGDVLVTNRGEIGKIALVQSEYNNSNLNSQIGIVVLRLYQRDLTNLAAICDQNIASFQMPLLQESMFLK